MFEKYSEYKDSETEWFGDIPKKWQLKKLKTIASFTNRGVTPSYVEFSDFKVVNQATFSKGYFDADNCKFTKVGPFEKIGAIKGTVFKNDILLASTGGGVLGKVAFFELDQKNYLADSHVTIIRGDGDFNPKFYYYILSINYDLINGILAQGSTNQTELQRDWLRDLIFPVPSPTEQTAIANFLDRKTGQIDQAIFIKEKQIELLKERRQILIHNSVTRGLNPDVRMKDSGVSGGDRRWIGEIPEHWNVFANRVLFTERNQPGREGLPLLSVSIHTAISSEELDEESNIRGKVKIEDKSNYKLVKVDDIVFNMMRAWQGAIGAVRVNGMVSPAYVVAKPNKKLDANYAEHQYRTSIYIQEMNRVSKGITDFRKRLYWHEFKQLTTILPPFEEQKEIVSYIENINDKIDTAISLKQKEIEKLKEYKSTLINSAVTGKIKVT